MFLRSANGFPVGCLSIDVNQLTETVSYQFSVLNPTDKFNREVARVMALGRLVENPIEVPTSQSCRIFADDKVSMHAVSKAVMSHIVASKAPARAAKAALLWLKNSQSMSTEKI